MTKRINVNPDHYKVAGRERPGDGVRREPKAAVNDDKVRRRWREKQKVKSNRGAR